MTNYSAEFKEEIVRKRLSGRPVLEISRETGVADGTIYAWVKKFKNKALIKTLPGPGKYPIAHKYKLLMQSTALQEEDKGGWFRENGVHPDHIDKWKNEIEDILLKPENYKKKYIDLKNDYTHLERELLRKEKALAEAAALLVLKKKYLALFEEKVT